MRCSYPILTALSVWRRGIVVLGATNRPGAIDSALIRPGRFDRIIYMPLPDTAGRAKILQVRGGYEFRALLTHKPVDGLPCVSLCTITFL